LFGVRDELAVTRSNGRTLQSAQSAMQSAIRSDYQDKFFRYNVGWFAPAVIIAAAAFVGGLFLQHPPDEGVGATRQTLIGSVIGWVLIVVGFRRYEALSWVFVNRVYGIILAAAGILAGSLAVYSAFQITQLLAYRTATIMIVIGIAILVLMFHLLRAPTLAGAKVLSRIEGFKLYLETAEANRLNLRDAPKMSEELFEKYLPYAAGLGVEEPWSEAYAAHLKRVAPNEDRTYQPIWYRGRDWSSHTIARSTAVAVVAISSAMASAMPQPKSSSGSSGGGSSGGGGGGGGGGGW